MAVVVIVVVALFRVLLPHVSFCGSSSLIQAPPRAFALLISSTPSIWLRKQYDWQKQDYPKKKKPEFHVER